MSLEFRKKTYQRLSPPHWPAATDQAWREAFRTGMWKDASKSRSLELQIARRLDVPKEWVLVTSSCTAALGVAFYLLSDEFPRERYDSVPQCRVCPLTYPATYCWGINNGLDMGWIDCDTDGWPVSEVDVGVDLWGRAFPRRCIILDAAHRVLDPRHVEGLRCGSWKAVTYSFGPQKEVPCHEGGALLSPILAGWREAAEAFIHSGQGRPLFGGFKGYLSAPAARAIGRQFAVHSRMKEWRQKVLEEYREWFGDDLLTQPGQASGHLAVVRLRTPGHKLAAMSRLKRLAIDHSTHYPIAEEFPCPGAKSLSQSVLTLPCHPAMRRHDVLLVARAVMTAV